MALINKSLFNFGLEIDKNNRSLDFRSSMGGPIFQATLNIGSYTLTELAIEVSRAMNATDPLNDYNCIINRAVDDGLANNFAIQTTGSYLELLFGTGPRAASTCSYILGFNQVDYTGATSYVGSFSAGTILIPEYVGYSYLGPDFVRSIFGALNISARGDKEAIVWQVQKFFQVEFKFEPEAKVIDEWSNFLTWSIQQKPLEFTPNVASPSTYYQCTLESSEADGKGLGYKMTEMLPDFPFNYRTGILKFRQKVN